MNYFWVTSAVFLLAIGLIVFGSQQEDQSTVIESVLELDVSMFEDENLDASQQMDRGRAIGLVQERPEVKEWIALFGENGVHPDTGNTPHVVYDGTDPNGIISVHVYEDQKERIVTFGWYEVDLVAGVAEKVIPL